MPPDTEEGWKMIKFLDLHKINERFRAEMDAATKRVLDSGWYLLGRECEAFESEFAAFCGVRHAIGCANGLDALKLVVKAMGIGSGDEVIAPANTYIASLIAISANGATPVLVEPDLSTYLIDPAKIEEKITPRTKAIMVVHLYGRVCEMGAVSAVAKRHGLKIIEDCAREAGGDLYEALLLNVTKPAASYNWLSQHGKCYACRQVFFNRRHAFFEMLNKKWP